MQQRFTSLSRRSATLLLGSAATLLGANAAFAGFTNPYVPPYRGLAGSEYGAWEVFTIEHSGANLPDEPGATTVDAYVEQLDTSAILVTGNIYSFQAPIDCLLGDSVASDLKELHLQISTKGNELDYAGVVLVYVDGLGVSRAVLPTSIVELAKIPNMGFDVETLFHWDLEGIADTITAYQILFTAAQTHTSLDAVTLDTRTAEFVTKYCTAKTNSQGCTPAIGWSGVPSASSPAPFLITAGGILPGTVGVLVYGTSGAASIPFQGGFLCMGAPSRTQGFSSGGSAPCTGSFSYDFNALVQSGQGVGLAAGKQVQAQFWSRDTGFAPPNASSLTDAVQFVIED
jgi:hypothetical protein